MSTQDAQMPGPFQDAQPPEPLQAVREPEPLQAAQPPDPFQAAAELQAKAAQLQAKYDPLGLTPALATVWQRATENRLAMLQATTRLATGAMQTPLATAARAMGVETGHVIEPDPKDRRFSSPAWSGNAAFFGLQQMYAVACRFADDVLAAGHNGGDLDDQKAAFATRLATEAMAPSNFPLTNPEVWIKAIETGGLSLVKGASNLLDDLVNRGGLPAQVDTSHFSLGRTLAATEGKVVFRNDLIELIQYAPQTDQVHQVPILCSPPWINKFYVMDLAPGRSFVEWAVQHQHTVFMISYRDPDSSMQHLSMDDYLEQGVLTALDVVADITGEDKVDLVGLCLGGAMATMAAAHLAARGEDRINTLTTMNTLIDYTAPGELGLMVDDATLERLGVRMRETGGVLPARDMATAFDLLRPRDLVFRYVPSRWLMGEPAPVFDVLAWNADSVRMPATMHTQYLHSLYGQNRLAAGTYELAGQRLDLGALTADTYVVGAVNDHIVPWQSSYAVTPLVGGAVRYVLTNGGHIAGIVNPPGPKAWFEALPMDEHGQQELTPVEPDAWRDTAHRQDGTWWQDWSDWIAPRSGDLVDPPPVGGPRHRPIASAPGRYVLD